MSGPRSGQPRRVWVQLFRNFIDSFKPLQSTKEGYYVGCDLNGNKFYEVPPEPEKGKRHPRRWFVPEKEMNFDVSNMSAEWDAWLRNRRNNAPTLEELEKNFAISEMKKSNAERLRLSNKKLKHAFIDEKHPNMTSFPRYDEYEVNPGEGAVRFSDDDKKK